MTSSLRVGSFCITYPVIFRYKLWKRCSWNSVSSSYRSGTTKETVLTQYLDGTSSRPADRLFASRVELSKQRKKAPPNFPDSDSWSSVRPQETEARPPRSLKVEAFELSIHPIIYLLFRLFRPTGARAIFGSFQASLVRSQIGQGTRISPRRCLFLGGLGLGYSMATRWPPLSLCATTRQYNIR